jgi:hypothetical protein
MSDWQLNTPVAFIIFNRLDTTERVFAEIAKAKPPKLLVVADGARPTKAGEVEKVAATRAIINRVDWDCEVLTNYSEVNLGCKDRVSSGIDWVFEQVEEAIILEDDCLPDPTFFRFCQEMLDRYRSDLRIGVISGNNFKFENKRNNDSYYFSKYVHIWGWATWRNRWKNHYDVNIYQWPIIKHQNWLSDIFGDEKESKIWTRVFDKMYKKQIDTWDYQWIFANWINNRISIIPNVNLISNIGFGEGASHTRFRDKTAELKTEPLLFPLTTPRCVCPNASFDKFVFNLIFNISVIKKIKTKLLNVIIKLQNT